MSFYDELAATAAGLIARFGAPGTLSAVSSTYDPTSGSAATTQQDYPVVAAIFDMAEHRTDGRVLSGDKKVLMSTRRPNGSALAVTPRTDMTFTDGAGTVFKIITVKPLAPALTAVMFELQVRQ